MQARNLVAGLAAALALAAPAGADTISADGRTASGAFTVTAFENGPGKNGVDLGSGRTKMHGSVLCHAATGDRGVAGFVVDKSTDPAWPVGSYGYAFADDATKDNTGKPGSSLDAVGFAPATLPPNCVGVPFGTTSQITKGFVFVFDSDA